MKYSYKQISSLVVCALVLFYISSFAVRAGDAKSYHVDALAGDDARDGLSPQTAWQSLVRVNAAPLQPGDRVLFKRGCTWRGQLVPQSGAASAQITYGAYGDGPKPRLLGSVSMSAEGDWREAGSNLWATVPISYDAGVVAADLRQVKWSLHREGGADAALSVLPSDGGAGQTLKIDVRQAGAQRNHIQLSTSNLKLVAGQFYQVSLKVRGTGRFVPGNVVLSRQGSPWTSYVDKDAALREVGEEWTEQKLLFKASHAADDARLCFFLGNGLPSGSTFWIQPVDIREAKCNQAVPLSVDVGNIVFDGGPAVGIKKWSVADLRKDNDYVYNKDLYNVTVYSAKNPALCHRSIEFAMNRHIINQGGKSFITYENLSLSLGAAHGIGGGSTRGIIVRGCEISYIGGGHQFTGPDGRPVRFGNGVEFWAGASDCLVEDCLIWEIYDAALTNQGSGTNTQENITYRRNVIWNSEYSFEYWNRDAASRTRNIRFENNSCTNAGFGWGHTQRPDPNGRHVMFYDNTADTRGVFLCSNVFYNATDSCLRLHGRDWTGALTMDYNQWFQSKGPVFLWGKESIMPNQLAGFAHARGFETHSIPVSR